MARGVLCKSRQTRFLCRSGTSGEPLRLSWLYWRREARNEMKQRTVQTLYAYWNELRAGRAAPRRLEIEPSRLGAILPETFMLERAGPSQFKFRLAGTRLCELFGIELRGTDFLAGWSASDRAAVAENLNVTCEQGAATLLTVEAAADPTRRVELEVLMLPLLHSSNAIERVIGAMTPFKTPHWLGYDRLNTKRLVDHDLIWPDGQTLIEGSTSKPLFGAIAPRGVHSERPLLRVVNGGRAED